MYQNIMRSVSEIQINICLFLANSDGGENSKSAT